MISLRELAPEPLLDTVAVPVPTGEYDPRVGAAGRRAHLVRQRRQETLVQNCLRLGALAACLALWYLVALAFPPLILPGPVPVVQSFVSNLDTIVDGAKVTLTETAAGFALGGLMGFVLGLLIGHSRRLEAILSLLVVVSQSVPKTALAPLFVLWFGFDLMPKIVIAALIAFFPLVENTATGLRRVDASYIKLFRSFGGDTSQIFWKLRLINASPYIFIACRIALVYSLVGAIVGEFVAGNRGLGAMVVAAQGQFSTTLLFAYLIALTILGMTLYALARGIESYLLNRLHLGEGQVGNTTTF